MHMNPTAMTTDRRALKPHYWGNETWLQSIAESSREVLPSASAKGGTVHCDPPPWSGHGSQPSPSENPRAFVIFSLLMRLIYRAA